MSYDFFLPASLSKNRFRNAIRWPYHARERVINSIKAPLHALVQKRQMTATRSRRYYK
jgi:hypothetical protein